MNLTNVQPRKILNIFNYMDLTYFKENTFNIFLTTIDLHIFNQNKLSIFVTTLVLRYYSVSKNRNTCNWYSFLFYNDREVYFCFLTEIVSKVLKAINLIFL